MTSRTCPYPFHHSAWLQSLMFEHPSQALEQGIFKKYSVEYVVIGPNEIEVWKANQKEYDQLFPVVHLTPRYKLYTLSQS